MKVLLAQVSPVVGDVAGNRDLVARACRDGRSLGADLVILPELVISGYPPRDLLDDPSFLEACSRAVDEAVAATDDGPVVVFGAPLKDEAGNLRNAAVVAHGGRCLARRYKCLLPTYDVFDEARYFVPHGDPSPVDVELGGRRVRLGVTVCEDLWNIPALFPDLHYAIDPVARLQGVDLVVNLSASPFHAASPFRASKARIRLELCRAQARKAGVPVLLCNQVGGNDELVFDGHSLAVAPDGRILGEGAPFAEDMVLVETDGTQDLPFRDLPFEEEVVETLTLGLRDYATRCGFRSAVLGLSGGIDSAIVAWLAARALGPANVVTIGMPGPFSAPISLQDARDLAANLGCDFTTLPIAGPYGEMSQLLAGRFAGRPFGLAEENLQARLRGVLVMALSNKEGHLALATGNKSELATGYCTLYGDMCGGLAPIADVFKTDVYRLARWINREGPVLPARILERPPTAELAPNQTDEASLMPYPVLDGILRLLLEEHASVEHVVSQGFDRDRVERVLRLVQKSEYKRRQAAPGLRISSKAFGMGRRIPLARRWMA